jgi:hypothetical protein
MLAQKMARCAKTLGVGNYLGLSGLKHGYGTVGGTEVNSYCATHLVLLLFGRFGRFLAKFSVSGSKLEPAALKFQICQQSCQAIIPKT